MFKNQYQGGPFVEIFSAQGKNPRAKWKIFGSPSAIWKEYDKEVKGFVFVLEGSSQINKMQLPKQTRQTLGLIQQFLTLQIFVPLGQDFSTELLITDLGNIKRRLYLSTVHRELSVTPLHAKIPLFTIKRKIWCNMCIDLVAFTSEIFRGAVFQSLDGIIISANCKLRKIFTLKSKPQDTAEEDDTSVPFVPCEPPNVIPETCQLNRGVPQVTQLLDLTKIRKAEVKCRRSPVAVQETVNTGQGHVRSSRAQGASHPAFPSKIPEQSSDRRGSTKVSGEKTMSIKVAKKQGHKNNRASQLQNSRKGTKPVQDFKRLEQCNDSLDEGGKGNTLQTTKDPAIQAHKTSEGGRADFQLASQEPSPDKNSHRRTESPLKNAAKTTKDISSDEEMLPEIFTESIQLEKNAHFMATEDSACPDLTSSLDASEHHCNETGDQQAHNSEIFMFSSRPRSAPHGKSPSVSPECCVFPLDLEQDSNRVHGKTQVEDNFQGTDSSEEDDSNEFIQGTEKLEISSSNQRTSDSAVSEEIPLNRMSWRNEDWKNKGQNKLNLRDTILSKPQSPTLRKTDSGSSQRILKPTFSLSPNGSKSEFFKVMPNGSGKERHEVPGQLERSLTKKSLKKISREGSCLATQTCEYDWKNYQSNRVSSSELQMLASMRRQQSEELQDTGISHGLSASQIHSCNVSISTTSDDTATWISCLPPPISQEHHYQKEMSSRSYSNPRDWLNMFSPPIIPGSQQLEECTKYSTNHSIPGEGDLSAEDDDEVLTLFYDPCLNCYFDPNSGKYYELA